MTGGEAPAELAERALGHTGGEAMATVTAERSLFSRFARSRPTQATGIDTVTVVISSVVDGHVGSAATNRTDDDALRDTAARARAAAAASATHGGHGDYPGLPGPQEHAGHDGFDAATADLDPAAAGAATAAAFEAAADRGVEAFGIWTAGDVRAAVASSTGLRGEDRVTDAFLRVMCRDAAGRTGFATGAGSALAQIDAPAIARRAAARVPRADDEPVELGPGEYPVVLAEDAVGLLLEFLGFLAFDGLAHAEGRGALDGRLGTQVAAPAIDLSDAARHPRTLPRRFDAEGVAKAEVPLIGGGVARAVCHDTLSAARAGDGARSTGHALAPGGSPEGAPPTNLVLAGGDAADEHELAAPIERGIYVTRLWYVNTVHPKETLLTGMTRDGTFLIEDGRITRPLRDVRFTDSVLRILESTEALTAEPRLTTDAEFYGTRFAAGTVCPALRARDFRVTGVSPG